MLAASKLRCRLLTILLIAGGIPVQPQEKPVKPAAAPPITLPFARIKPDATFDVPGDRIVLSSLDGIWIGSRESSSVVRIDAKTAKATHTIKLAGPPCGGLVEAFGALWVPVCGTPAGVARLDTKTYEVAATITRGISAIAGAPTSAVRSVWLVVDQKGTLLRIDPETNAGIAEIYLGAGAHGVVSGPDALWVPIASTQSVARVNPNNNLIVETIKVGKQPRSVAVGEGAVWSLNAGDGSVSRIDPKTNKVTETVTLGVKVGDGQIVAGEGSVWITAPALPLIRVDPRTNRVAQIFTGAGGGAMAIGHGSIWIVSGPKTVARIDPKLVEATRY
jgi:YVTN family beta-propeller protein